MYGIVVALPLLFLFGRVAWQPAPQSAPGDPAAAQLPQVPESPGRSDGLPPFDAYGADEAPTFPDLVLAAVADNGTRRLSLLRAGPTIVHLWSLSCETCADEWPAMQAFARASAATKGKIPPVLSVLVVPDETTPPGDTARSSLDAIRRDGWFGRAAPDLTAQWAVPERDVLSDAQTPKLDRPITGYPETFVLDGRGRIRLRLVGPMAWDASTWDRLLGMLSELQ
jgi:thiol-disulfide isomerase/thioredoxin